MLNIESVSAAIGDTRIIDDLSLDVADDQVIGLIGPNGAGKSTLLSVVSGFIAPVAGRVRYDGRDLTQVSPEGRLRAGVGRSFQVPQEFSEMTVWENLAVAVPGQQGESFGKLLLMPRRVRNREAEVRVLVDRVLARLALSHVATSRAGTLSGGQKKLLELGRLLLANPKLILLDEPFAGVNPVMIERISELIVQLHKEGHGFLIVEHNIPALAKLTNYLHVMDRGRLIASGRPRTVLKDPKVRAAYIGGDA